MNVHRLRITLACAVVMLAMAFAAIANAAAPAQPSLTVTTLQGKPFNLAAHRGQWVIVNFWATWCSPCIAEMPAISRYVAAHHDVSAIGLAYDRSPAADIAKFAKKHPVDYPLAQLDMNDLPTGLPMPLGLPTTYLIAPDGKLAKTFVGPINAKLLDAAIAAAKPGAATAKAR